jgi:hypothetical protein
MLRRSRSQGPARPGGKNVFGVTATLGGASCRANLIGTVSGIALHYPISGTAQSQLVIGVVNTARSAGLGMFGNR